MDCREYLPGVGPTSNGAYICCVKVGTCTGITISQSARYYEGGCKPAYGKGLHKHKAMMYYASRNKSTTIANTSTSTDYPTSTEGCVKQGECALPYLEHIHHRTALGGTMETATPSDETIDRLLYGAVEAYPDACRAADLYPRTAVAATHHASSTITILVCVSHPSCPVDLRPAPSPRPCRLTHVTRGCSSSHRPSSPRSQPVCLRLWKGRWRGR